MKWLAAINSGRDATMAGILYIVGGVAILSLQDAFIKMVSQRYPIHEILVLRTLFTLIPVFIMIHLEGGPRIFKTGRTGLHLVRGVSLLTAYGCYFSSLLVLPMADTVAIFFVAPLFVALLSVRVLGERLQRAQTLALVVGFVGVLVMVRPGVAVFNPASLLAVTAAFFYALVVVLTRVLGPSSQGSVLAFYPNLVYLVAGAAIGMAIGDGRLAISQNPTLQFLLGAWKFPSGGDWGLLALAGLMAGVAFYALAQAYRLAQATAIAPFEYSAMPLAVLWGFLFFGDIPDYMTVLGIIMIGGSGLYLAHHSR